MIRKIARPMLASVFVWDGVDTMRNTPARIAETEAALRAIRAAVPAEYKDRVPHDPELFARGLAATKVSAASLFGLGKAPRIAASVLALTHLPTLLGRNAFWEAETPEAKEQARNGFVTNVALLGALAIITQDTEGNPSLRWRAQKAGKHTAARVQAALPTKSESEKLADTVSDRAAELSGQAQALFADTTAKAQTFVDDHRDEWESTGRGLLDTAKTYVEEAKHAAQAYVDEHRDDWESTGRALVESAKTAKASAQQGSETARAALLANAAKAQERADAAVAAFAANASDVNAAEAAARAEKLQERADAALATALRALSKQL